MKKLKNILALLLLCFCFISIPANTTFAQQPWEMTNLDYEERAIMWQLLNAPGWPVMVQSSSLMKSSKVVTILVYFICGNYYANDPQMNSVYIAWSDGEAKIWTDNYTYQAIKAESNNYEATLLRINSEFTSETNITGQETQIELVKKINYWICNRFNFNLDAAYYPVSQVLDTHQGVCSQFTQLFKYCCDYYNIPCDFVTSIEMGHAFNRVTIDGQEYYIDPTWNITSRNQERWLLLPESIFRQDHNF